MAITKKRLVCFGGQLTAFIHYSENIPFPKTRPHSPESSSDCCSTVRMLNYLTGVPWKRGTGMSFFAVYQAGDGSIKKFASGK